MCSIISFVEAVQKPILLMKLIIIRHGDPDYSIDSLTEKGWREAELLSDRISKLDVTAFYCSPLGRAKDTESFTLKKMNTGCFDVTDKKVVMEGEKI